MGPRTCHRPHDQDSSSLPRNRSADEGSTRAERGIPSYTSSTTPALFSARSTSCFGSVVARFGIGATILVVCLLSAHLVGGYLTDTPFRRLAGEFSNSWLGRKLATSGDISVRLAAPRAETGSVSPSCRGNGRAKLIRSEAFRALIGVRSRHGERLGSNSGTDQGVNCSRPSRQRDQYQSGYHADGK